MADGLFTRVGRCESGKGSNWFLLKRFADELHATMDMRRMSLLERFVLTAHVLLTHWRHSIATKRQ